MILSSKKFEQTIQSDDLVLVDFYADWCGPCKMMSPNIEELAKRYPNQVYKLNIDMAKDIAMKYQIRSIPTLIVFKNGQPIKSDLGYKTLEQLERLLND